LLDYLLSHAICFNQSVVVYLIEASELFFIYFSMNLKNKKKPITFVIGFFAG